MNRRYVRPFVAAVCAFAVCVAFGPRPDAARTAGPLERFVARAQSQSTPAEIAGPVAIMIDHWSSDAELDALRGTLVQRGAAALLPELQKIWRPAGVVLVPGIPNGGSRGLTPRMRTVRFARQIETPAGRQVILVADMALAFGEPSRTWPSDYAFTLLDIRFGLDGKGVGKLAAPDKVVYNNETKIIELEDYRTQPVRLTDVKSERP
jgi:hypothetical protein